MWIRVRTGEDAGREVTLEPGRPLVLGRAQGSDVVVRCPRASRRHAEIRRLAGERVLLRDLGSANGTWVDGERVAEAVLGDGDEVRIGEVSLRMAAAATAPSLSAIGRMVELRTRRSLRFTAAAAGLALAAAAGVVGAAPCEDIALLRVADTGGLRSAVLGSGDAVRQGETVVALGYPDGAGVRDELTSTTGVVSVARTRYADPGPDVPAYPEAVQTDTALNPGNSGGPLVDLEGRLVGMNAAVRTAGQDGRSVQNQNYAIAVDRIRAVLARLRTGMAAPGWTGLTVAFPSPQVLADRRLPAGLLVTGALPGSPAARAGLGSTSEALVGVDDRPVGTTLRSYCAATAAAGDAAPRSVSLARPGTGAVRRVALPAAG